MSRLYEHGTLSLDLDAIAGIDEVADWNGTGDTHLFVHLVGGGELSYLQHEHPNLLPRWRVRIQRMEHEKVRN